MKYKLSILICTIYGRERTLSKLLQDLEEQVKDKPVEVLWLGDLKTMSIGTKRNFLLSMAKGEYSCFIDDDDEISIDYIDKILEAAEEGSDVISFDGYMYVDGRRHAPVIYSIKEKVNHRNQDTYYRIPNHLMPMKTEIRLKHLFEEINWGEDSKNAIETLKDIKTETKINKILYHYKYKRGKWNQKNKEK